MVLLSAAFGGCFAEDEKTALAASESAGPGANATLANTAPVAVILVSFNGTALVADNGTFTAAVGQNLSFDASNSTDAESGNLTYTWDFDGNATVENMTTTYAFNATGNRTVVLTVTDEGGMAGVANLTLVIGTSGPAPGTFLREDVQAFGNAPGGNYVAAGCNAALSKTWTLVDVEADGTASVVQNVTVTMAAMTSTGLNAYTKLAFKDPAGTVIMQATSGSGAKKLVVPGPLAAGVYKVEAQVCSTYLSTMTNSPAVAGTAVYVTA